MKVDKVDETHNTKIRGKQSKCHCLFFPNSTKTCFYLCPFILLIKNSNSNQQQQSKAVQVKILNIKNPRLSLSLAFSIFHGGRNN